MPKTQTSDSYTKVVKDVLTNGDVMAYEGENYYRGCGEFVSDLLGGGSSTCVKRVNHPGHIHEDYDGRTLDEREESKLVGHARRELMIIGEEPEFIEWYLGCIRAFVEYGHSGGSAFHTIPIIQKLLKGENLSALTDDPDEWYHHETEMWDGKTGIWQNKRNTKMFSSDQGKSYWNVDDPSRGAKPTEFVKNRSKSNSPKPRAEHYG